MRIVTVPSSLDERTFDAMIRSFAEGSGGRTLVDARHLAWVDPYGMLGLLAVGAVAARSGDRPVLHLPEMADVLSYLARMGFFEQAESIYEIHGPQRRSRAGDTESDVLLEITPIRSHTDIHEVVDRVHVRAQAILTRQLAYPANESFQFAVILAEVCQNIVDHAGAEGWVAVQRYSRTRRLNRPVVRIGVVDLGIGFKESLTSTHAGRFGERWGDATALEAAFIHGLTRFHDPGRGQGIQQIRRRVAKWNAKFSIRSGTARIADIPDWDDAPPLEEGLPHFPGTQISIELPKRVGEDASARPPVPAGARERRQ